MTSDLTAQPSFAMGSGALPAGMASQPSGVFGLQYEQSQQFGAASSSLPGTQTAADAALLQQQQQFQQQQANETPRNDEQQQQQQQPTAAQQAQQQAPHIILEGQRPIDKNFLFATSSVRFVGFVHTSEKFVDGKVGGLNTDLLDVATARGGVDPATAVNGAGRVWKERTFLVEPSAEGWTMRIVKMKLGGESHIKHTINMRDISSVDIMTSNAPLPPAPAMTGTTSANPNQNQQNQQNQNNMHFRVPARTTADTQAKTHFWHEFQSYMSISLGRQHLEIACRSQEALVRNYTFTVKCLEATATLSTHYKRLQASGLKIDQEHVNAYVQAITNEQQGLVTPIVFNCQLSLSKKLHEPHLQLRGEASVAKAVLAMSSSSSSPPGGGGDTRGSIKIKTKFRILLHPNNLNPRRTQEGLIMLVQSDDHHMVPIELRPVPGKSKLFDPDLMRKVLVEAIDAMYAMGQAMAMPKKAVEALTNPEVAAQLAQQSQAGGGAAAGGGGGGGGMTTQQQELLQQQQNAMQAQQMQQQQNLLNRAASGGGVGGGALSSQSPQHTGGGGGGGGAPPSTSLGVPGKVASSSSSTYIQQPNHSIAATSSFLFTARFQGNVIEQLETGARFRLEATLMETLRSLLVAARPSVSAGGRGGMILPSIPPSSTPSRYSGAFQPEVLSVGRGNHPYAVSSNAAAGGGAASSSSLSPSPAHQHTAALLSSSVHNQSSRYVQHQMQRHGAVPIAVSQLAPSHSVVRGGDGMMNSWEFQPSSTWPSMLPGDDVHDYRLHLARILANRVNRGQLKENPGFPSAALSSSAASSSAPPQQQHQFQTQLSQQQQQQRLRDLQRQHPFATAESVAATAANNNNMSFGNSSSPKTAESYQQQLQQQQRNSDPFDVAGGAAAGGGGGGGAASSAAGLTDRASTTSFSSPGATAAGVAGGGADVGGGGGVGAGGPGVGNRLQSLGAATSQFTDGLVPSSSQSFY